uniref:Uncharacterized protein n=1 Tax=Physcomitrium patens TaxID=3218 RepID=A0A7I4FJ53_PHYPA
MPFTRRPLQTTITFVALNGVLCLSLGPIYDFVCDLPYWARRVTMLELHHRIACKMAVQFENL